MTRPPLDFRKLRQRIPPINALRLVNWRGHKEACGSWRGPCPFHVSKRDQSRSLSVSDMYWYCHKEKVGGDAVELWARLRQLPKLEAAYELCDRLGIDPIYLQP